MFSVLGVDVSSHSVDLVALDENSDRAEWTRLPLAGQTPFERCRAVSAALPQPGWFEARGVYLVAIEKPRSKFYASLAAQLPVFGAVAAHLPDELEVWELAPTEWRKTLGMAGNASKAEVADWAWQCWREQDGAPAWDAPQDCWDAYVIAYAARTLNEQAIARKVALA